MPNYAASAPKLSKTARALEAASLADIHDADQLRSAITQLRAEMKKAADDLEFERAAELRDSIEEIKEQLGEGEE